MRDVVGNVQKEQFTREFVSFNQIFGEKVRSVRLGIIGRVAGKRDHRCGTGVLSVCGECT